MKLRDIAHSRTGDKGNTSNVSLIAYDPNDYDMLCTYVTTDRVKQLFGGIVNDVCKIIDGLLKMILHKKETTCFTDAINHYFCNNFIC